jgi:sugar lactone lactonase YvrE
MNGSMFALLIKSVNPGYPVGSPDDHAIMAETETRLEAALLDPRDDVATALVDLPAGRALTLAMNGQRYVVFTAEPIPAGHKLAVRALGADRRIRKYGEFIGRMTSAAAAGAWVHSHNLATNAVRSLADERAWRAQAGPACVRPIAERVRCRAGVAPLFDAGLGRLHWIDTGVPALYSLDITHGSTVRTALPSPAHAALLMHDGAVLIAVDGAFMRVDTGWKVSPTAARAALPPPLQWTGLQCDTRGRVWGTAAVPGSREADGTVCVFDPRTIRTEVRGLLSPAGLAWNAGGAKLLVAESGRAAIMCCDVDHETGGVGAPRPFADLGTMPGELGGMTTDAEDHVWIALPGASCLVRLAPAGTLERVVRLPVSRPTDCAFGGDGHARLYVTTAAARLPDPGGRAEEAWAGQVLELDVGAAGRPPHRATDLAAAVP